MNEFPYVFLSYATADRDIALKIADALEASGVKVWIDRRGISGGDIWAAEITAAIRTSSAMALICTASSIASRNVQQEVQLAWDNNVPIVPLMLEQVTFPDELAYFLQGRQWVEVPNDLTGNWIINISGLISPSEAMVMAFATNEVSASRRTSNLPVPATQILGRDLLVKEIGLLLDTSDGRLLTLVGPGGVGKTRLALEVAWELERTYDGSIQFVDLSQIRDPKLVIPAIASELGVRISGSEPSIDSLVSALREESLLLILDNWEQVLSAAADLGKLLTGLPNLKVIATSREPLRLRAEQTIDVAPLAVAASKPTFSLAMENPAVALFVARAKSARQGFALTEDNFDQVLEICRRLDGLPLAIELAASRSTMLAPEQLLHRLEHRLPLLSGGARDLPERQQTLRDAIAWSEDLLSDGERAVLRRVAVFAGGFNLESAFAVTDIPTEFADDLDVFAALERLVGHSLLRMTIENDSQRFQMLETIREFAQVRLEESGEFAEAHLRHARWFLDLAEASSEGLAASEQKIWLKRMSIEQDNLRTALAWTVSEQPEMALRLSTALLKFWLATGVGQEASLWYQRALDSGKDVDPLLIARTEVAAARVDYVYGNFTQSEELANQALKTFERSGDEQGITMALAALGGRFLFAEGETEKAGRYLSEALDRARKLGDGDVISYVGSNLAVLKSLTGDHDSAISLYQETATHDREIGNMISLATILCNQLELLVFNERVKESKVVLKEIIEIWQQVQNLNAMNLTLRSAALVFGSAAEPEFAARIAGAAETETKLSNFLGYDLEVFEYEAKLAQLRDEMGADAFDSAFKSGSALSLEMAFAEINSKLEFIGGNSST